MTGSTIAGDLRMRPCDSGGVSFDVFVQAFRSGDTATADATAVRDVLAPHVSEADASGFARLVAGDGEADLYGYDDLSSGFMASHISGEHAWDLLVDAAKVARLTILPVGGPTCVTTEETIAELPQELAYDVRLVESGADLRAAIGALG